MNATEPFAKCYSAVAHVGSLLLQRRTRAKGGNMAAGMLWYCFAHCSG